MPVRSAGRPRPALECPPRSSALAGAASGWAVIAGVRALTAWTGGLGAFGRGELTGVVVRGGIGMGIGVRVDVPVGVRVGVRVGADVFTGVVADGRGGADRCELLLGVGTDIGEQAPIGRLNDVVPTITVAAVTATTPTAAVTTDNPNQARLTMSSRRSRFVRRSATARGSDRRRQFPLRALGVAGRARPATLAGAKLNLARCVAGLGRAQIERRQIPLRAPEGRWVVMHPRRWEARQRDLDKGERDVARRSLTVARCLSAPLGVPVWVCLATLGGTEPNLAGRERDVARGERNVAGRSPRVARCRSALLRVAGRVRAATLAGAEPNLAGRSQGAGGTAAVTGRDRRSEVAVGRRLGDRRQSRSRGTCRR